MSDIPAGHRAIKAGAICSNVRSLEWVRAAKSTLLKWLKQAIEEAYKAMGETA